LIGVVRGVDVHEPARGFGVTTPSAFCHDSCKNIPSTNPSSNGDAIESRSKWGKYFAELSTKNVILQGVSQSGRN